MVMDHGTSCLVAFTRAHDVEIVETIHAQEGDAVVVDNVFRKGGYWRVEGVLAQDQAKASYRSM